MNLKNSVNVDVISVVDVAVYISFFILKQTNQLINLQTNKLINL
jgi:hypothetical protein